MGLSLMWQSFFDVHSIEAVVAVGACGVGDYAQIGSYLWHGICTLKSFNTYLSLPPYIRYMIKRLVCLMNRFGRMLNIRILSICK